MCYLVSFALKPAGSAIRSVIAFPDKLVVVRYIYCVLNKYSVAYLDTCW